MDSRGGVFGWYIRTMVTRKTAEQRYWEKLRPPTPDGCVDWGASIDRYGHAKFSYTDNGRKVDTSGHKFGWKLRNGPIPDGQKLKNTCGLKSCQNMAHWTLEGNGKGLTIVERYEARFTRLGPDECWPWQEKSRDKDGYGILSWRVDGESVCMRATRFGWNIHHPDDHLRAGEVVCHTCDNPPCQNPAHWFRGSVATNNADMMSKGRHWAPSAESHHRSKLSWDDVYEIRRRASRGTSQQVLANEFHVSREAVSKIVRNERWRERPRT